MRLKRWIWRRNTKQPLTTSNLKSQNKVNIYLYQQIDKSAVRTLKKIQAATSAQELFVLIVGYYNIETSAKNKNITNNGNRKITRNDGNNDNTSNSIGNNGNDIPDKIETQEKFYRNLVAEEFAGRRICLCYQVV